MIQAKVTAYYYKNDPDPFYRVEYKKWFFWEYDNTYITLNEAVIAANRLKLHGGKRKETVVYRV